MNDMIAKIEIEPHFAGDYRLEYDGKYVTMFGKNKDYDMSGMYGAPEGTYDEGVLVPVVAEVRHATFPKIIEVTETHITVSWDIEKPNGFPLEQLTDSHDSTYDYNKF